MARRRSDHGTKTTPIENASWGSGVTYPTSSNIAWFTSTESRPAECLEDLKAQEPLPCPPIASRSIDFIDMHGTHDEGGRVNPTRRNDGSTAAGSRDTYNAGAVLDKQNEKNQ